MLKNLTLYLLNVVRKEGLSFPLNGCCIKKRLHMYWLYLACSFVFTQDKLTVAVAFLQLTE